MIEVFFDKARVPSQSGFLAAVGGDHCAETVLFLPPEGQMDPSAVGFVKLGAPGMPLVKKALDYDSALGGYVWTVERAEVVASRDVSGLMAQFTLESRENGINRCWESRAFPVTIAQTIEMDEVIGREQPVYLLGLDIRVAAAAARAEAAAGALAQPTAVAQTLSSGQDATVALETSGGKVVYRFGLPRGEKGEKGDPGSLDTEGKIAMHVVEGLEEALTQVDQSLAGKSAIGHAHSEYLTAHQDISAKLDKAGGAMTGMLAAGGAQDVHVAQVRNIIFSPNEPSAGVSPLETGTIWLTYE